MILPLRLVAGCAAGLVVGLLACNPSPGGGTAGESGAVAPPGTAGQPTASEFGSIAAEQRDLPKFDRENFRLSSQSIARPDLLACRNMDARVTKPGEANIEEFARLLHGTWINQNRRTLHGMPVETDAIFLIDLRGATGQAILIDQNNMAPRWSNNVRSTRGRPPGAYTFVDCTYEFLDQYVKVSDDVDLAALGRGSGVSLAGTTDLTEAWRRISESSFFASLPMRTGSEGAVQTLAAPRLGDRSRTAVLQSGATVTEADIAAGRAPGAEYRLPMQVGALFKISLELRRAPGSQFNGVFMRWDAEYRGTGVNIDPATPVTGVEQGTFVREGDSYVASVGMDAWRTSSCGNKNGLNALVGDPALRNDPAHAGHDHESLVFTRVVLGAPMR